MIHFCSDELMQIQAMIPFASDYISKLNLWLRSKKRHKQKEECPVTKAINDQSHDYYPHQYNYGHNTPE